MKQFALLAQWYACLSARVAVVVEFRRCTKPTRTSQPIRTTQHQQQKNAPADLVFGVCCVMYFCTGLVFRRKYAPLECGVCAWHILFKCGICVRTCSPTAPEILLTKWLFLDANGRKRDGFQHVYVCMWVLFIFAYVRAFGSLVDAPFRFNEYATLHICRLFLLVTVPSDSYISSMMATEEEP